MEKEIEKALMKKAYAFDLEQYKKVFYNHKVNGVHLQFPNGNSLSTIWGTGTYSDNYDYSSDISPIDRIGSNTCEVMPDCSIKVKEKLDEMFPENENGSVFGRLSFEQWLKMVNYLNENK
jgi:hypothetical protein